MLNSFIYNAPKFLVKILWSRMRIKKEIKWETMHLRESISGCEQTVLGTI